MLRLSEEHNLNQLIAQCPQPQHQQREPHDPRHTPNEQSIFPHHVTITAPSNASPISINLARTYESPRASHAICKLSVAATVRAAPGVSSYILTQYTLSPCLSVTCARFMTLTKIPPTCGSFAHSFAGCRNRLPAVLRRAVPLQRLQRACFESCRTVSAWPHSSSPRTGSSGELARVKCWTIRRSGPARFTRGFGIPVRTCR